MSMFHKAPSLTVSMFYFVTSFRLLHSSLLYESSLISLETINYSPLFLPKTCYLCHSEMLPMLHYICLLTSLFCEKTIGPVVVNSVYYQNKVYISLLWESAADLGNSQGQLSAPSLQWLGHPVNSRPEAPPSQYKWFSLPWQKRKIRYFGGAYCLIWVCAVHISLAISNHRGLLIVGLGKFVFHVLRKERGTTGEQLSTGTVS